MQIINWLKSAILQSGKKFYEVLVGKINEPKLKNFQLIDLYVLIACPEQTIVDFKRFNTNVICPHEALMALKPDLFPWECKIITDYNVLLMRQKDDQELKNEQEIFEHEHQADETALVSVSEQNRELIPIFSSQVLSKYEKFSYKGLEVDLQA